MDFDRIVSLAGLLFAIASLAVDLVALAVEIKKEGGSGKPPSVP
jgi:hypothetical protein